MPTVFRDVHGATEGKPDFTRRHTIGKRLISAAVAQLLNYQIAQERPALEHAKLVANGDEEFATSHSKNLANSHVRIELCYQFIGQRVRNGTAGNNVFEYRESVAHFVQNF